jgi:hypothetical protein
MSAEEVKRAVGVPEDAPRPQKEARAQNELAPGAGTPITNDHLARTRMLLFVLGMIRLVAVALLVLGGVCLVLLGSFWGPGLMGAVLVAVAILVYCHRYVVLNLGEVPGFRTLTGLPGSVDKHLNWTAFWVLLMAAMWFWAAGSTPNAVGLSPLCALPALLSIGWAERRLTEFLRALGRHLGVHLRGDKLYCLLLGPGATPNVLAFALLGAGGVGVVLVGLSGLGEDILKLLGWLLVPVVIAIILTSVLIVVFSLLTIVGVLVLARRLEQVTANDLNRGGPPSLHHDRRGEWGR